MISSPAQLLPLSSAFHRLAAMELQELVKPRYQFRQKWDLASGIEHV